MTTDIFATDEPFDPDAVSATSAGAAVVDDWGGDPLEDPAPIDPPTPDPISVVQSALRREAELFGAAGEFYQPSPGQMLDHVNHRVASLAIQALKAEGLL